MDEEPLDGQYPTSLWVRGEQLKDIHQLPIPQNAVAGSYRVAVGLYLWDTGERLLLSSESGPVDALSLGEIVVGGNVADR